METTLPVIITEVSTPFGGRAFFSEQHPTLRTPMDDLSLCATELPGLGFLSHVSSEHRSFLSCFGKFHRPEAGTVLITEDQTQDSLYIILSGHLHIVSEVDGRQVLIASLGEGDAIGEVNLFDPGNASASVIVRSPSVIWSLTRDELEAFVEADPAAGISVFRGLLAQVSRRIRTMNEKLAAADKKSSLHHYWESNE